jgi:hypothetical protein
MTTHDNHDLISHDRRLPVKVSAGIAAAAAALVAAVPAISGSLPGFISAPASLPFIGHKHHHKPAKPKSEAQALPAPAAPPVEPAATAPPRTEHRRKHEARPAPHVIRRVRQPHSGPAPRPAPQHPRHADGTGGTRAPDYQVRTTQPEPTYGPQPTYEPNSAPQPTQTTDGDSTTQPTPTDGGKRDGGDVSR